MTGSTSAFAVPLLRGALQWLFGILFALSLIAFFLVINLMQLTTAGTGQRILSRAVADLTEIDAILPTIQADLVELAQDSEGAPVTVPLFPVPVELPPEEAATISTAELRSLLLSEAAEAVYEDGWSVWALADPEAEQDIDVFSPEWGVHRGLGFVSDDNHQALRIAAIILGLLSAALAGLVLVSAQGMGRLLALGAALLGAAVPSLLAAVAIRFAFRTAKEDQEDYMLVRLLDLGNEATWLALRNYTILTLVGLGVLMLGLMLVLLEARQRAAPPPAPVVDSGPPAIDNGPAEA
jgi:hypothetical protein